MITNMRLKLHITLFATLGLACMVFGDTRNWNPMGAGCVDSEGFLSCCQKQSDIAATCACIRMQYDGSYKRPCHPNDAKHSGSNLTRGV